MVVEVFDDGGEIIVDGGEGRVVMTQNEDCVGIDDQNIPALCRALYDAAGLGWPEHQHPATHEAIGNNVLAGETVIDPAASSTTPAEDLDFVPEMAKSEEELALLEAQALAKALHRQHYFEVKQWRVFDDLRGVISQISNMTCGLTLKEPTPDLPDLKAALEGLREKAPKVWGGCDEASRPDALRLLCLLPRVEEVLAASRNAGLLTETKREPEPLEVAVKALEDIAKTQGLPLGADWGSVAIGKAERAREALAAIKGRKA
jgi:uncharacterized protein YfkK (UPF0435 family)